MLVQDVMCHPVYWEGGLVADLVEERHLWALSGDLLELCVEVLVLEVLVDERPDLGELVQSSSGARLHFAGMNCWIFPIGL